MIFEEENPVFEMELIGGPLDGVQMPWKWDDDPAGHAGRESGEMRLGNGLRYRANPEKTKAHYVAGEASPRVLKEYLSYPEEDW